MSEPEKRHGVVTAVHKEEARKLKAIWNARKEDLKRSGDGTQESFGAQFDIGNQSSVWFFLNGRAALSMKAALGFARGLQCSVADFSPRLAARLDGVQDLEAPDVFGPKLTPAALELAQRFDEVPPAAKRHLYAVLLSEIRRASTHTPRPAEPPSVAPRAPTRTARGKSRASP
jgi:hypothetical protein